jgi:hypothetical protein
MRVNVSLLYGSSPFPFSLEERSKLVKEHRMSDWASTLSESDAREADRDVEEQAKRIAQLRERLEQYNAAIAEAMGVTAAVTSEAFASDGAARGSGRTSGKSSKEREHILHPPTFGGGTHQRHVDPSSSAAATREKSGDRGHPAGEWTAVDENEDEDEEEEISASNARTSFGVVHVTTEDVSNDGEEDGEEEGEDAEEDAEDGAETTGDDEEGKEREVHGKGSNVQLRGFKVVAGDGAANLEPQTPTTPSVESSAGDPENYDPSGNSPAPREPTSSEQATADGPAFVNPLSIDQLENARFTIELLNETLATLAERHAESRRAKIVSRNDHLLGLNAKTQQLLRTYTECQAQQSILDSPAEQIAQDPQRHVHRFQTAMENFFQQRDELKPHFEPIFEIERQHRELAKRIQTLRDQLQHKRRQLDAERRQNRDLEEFVVSRERQLREASAEVEAQTKQFDKENPTFDSRLKTLEKREHRINQWLQILESKERQNAEQESRLRQELDRIAMRQIEIHAEKENLRRRADFLSNMSESDFGKPASGEEGLRENRPSQNRSNVKLNRNAEKIYGGPSAHLTREWFQDQFHQQSLIRDDDEEEEDEEDDDDDADEEEEDDDDQTSAADTDTTETSDVEDVIARHQRLLKLAKAKALEVNVDLSQFTAGTSSATTSQKA